MKKLIFILTIALFAILLLASATSASRVIGVMLSPGYYTGGHQIGQSGFGIYNISGDISIISGKSTQFYYMFGENFLKVNIDKPQPKGIKTVSPTNLPPVPEVLLPDLPGPDWSPSFSAP